MPVTWDPASASAGIVLSGGNLIATNPSTAGDNSVKSTVTGTKFYFETIANTITGGIGWGCCDSSFTSGNTGASTHAIQIFTDGNIYYNGSPIGNWLTPGNGDNASFAVDIANLKIWARVNGGNWENQPTDNPATNTGGFSLGTMGTPVNAIIDLRLNTQVTAKFASASWTYAAPSGFVQLVAPTVAVFRRSLSSLGTRIGSRQAQS